MSSPAAVAAPALATSASALGTYTDTSSAAGHHPSGEDIRRHWFTLRTRTKKLDRDDVAARQEHRDDARAERWAIRRGLRTIARGRTASCGLPGGRPDGSVVLRVTDARGTAAEASTGANGRMAGFGGLWTCGSVWTCPECSVRIAARRSQEVGSVLAHHVSTGGVPLLVTLTMRHHKGHTLDDCMQALTKAWGKVTSGRGIGHDYDRGLRGWLRAIEVTRSATNGWHVHVHAILVVESTMSEDAINALTGAWFARWSAALVRAGMPAPTLAHGLDVQRVPDGATEEASKAWARYVCKGLATEALMGSTKDAKGASRSMRQLMADATIGRRLEDPDSGAIVTMVDLHARDLVQEYEQVMRGRRQLTWSTKHHDLRRDVDDVDPELSDEEIAAEDLQGEEVAVLPTDSWKVVEPRATELLAITERHGNEAARSWLDDLGVVWWRPTRLTDSHRSGTGPIHDA